jgi:hypothetical protein
MGRRASLLTPGESEPDKTATGPRGTAADRTETMALFHIHVKLLLTVPQRGDRA